MGLPFRFTVVRPRRNVVHVPGKCLIQIFVLYSQQSKVFPMEPEERDISVVHHPGFIALSSLAWLEQVLFLLAARTYVGFLLGSKSPHFVPDLMKTSTRSCSN